MIPEHGEVAPAPTQANQEKHSEPCASPEGPVCSDYVDKKAGAVHEFVFVFCLAAMLLCALTYPKLFAPLDVPAVSAPAKPEIKTPLPSWLEWLAPPRNGVQ